MKLMLSQMEPMFSQMEPMFSQMELILSQMKLLDSQMKLGIWIKIFIFFEDRPFSLEKTSNFFKI
jgi:hypothetical protein